MSAGPIHYETVRQGEIRQLGTGYFQFSTDEKERAKQMQALHQLRAEVSGKEIWQGRHIRKVSGVPQSCSLDAFLIPRLKKADRSAAACWSDERQQSTSGWRKFGSAKQPLACLLMTANLRPSALRMG